MECYQRTTAGLEQRKLGAVVSREVVFVSLHRQQERAAVFMQRAWLGFQSRVSRDLRKCPMCIACLHVFVQEGRGNLVPVTIRACFP